MMTAMLAAGSSLAALIVVKVTVVAALGAAAWLARRNRAAVRHALLAVTFGAMLVLPIASIVAPPVHVTVPVAEVSWAARPLVVNTTAPIPPVTTADGDARVAPAAPQQSSTFSLSVLLPTVWIVGTAVFLMPVMTGLWQIRSLRRSGLPWLDGQSIAETLALDAGIHRRVEVLLHEALPGPITCGVISPAIVLPRDAESWAREDLSRAIVHELEHVRRGDSATRCLARAACALYWFHPLAWIAWRKLVLEAERSCDDAVLRRSEATAYADQLVGLAKRLPTAQKSPLLAMANRSDLSTRVGAVLDSRQRRGRAGTFSLALACAAALVLVLVMSPLTVVAAPQTAATEQQFEVASIRPGKPLGPLGMRFEVNGGPGTGDPGLFSCQNCALIMLIMRAYGLNAAHPFSAPGWMNDQRFDLQAKMPPGTTQEQFSLMLRNLLSERFKLAVHHEQKETPVYDLVIAKNGPKLKESVPHDAAKEEAAAIDPSQPFQKDKDGFPVIPPGSETTIVFGPGHARLRLDNETTLKFAELIAGPLQQPVIDATGLKGKYDFMLSWIPEQRGGTAPDSDSGPTLEGAIQAQLGLRLESKKGMVDVLVIDRAEKLPTGN